MSRLSTDLESELEDEFEQEFETEAETEGEDEDEAFLGALGGIARTVGGLLGEGEGEAEDEWEDEDEDEAFLGALGGIARTVGGLLGEGEDELEDEWEHEDELEDEGEEFFKQIGGWLRKAAPVLRVIAKTAGPLIATAVGGPAAGALARAVTSQLEGEGELEQELEEELENMAAAPPGGTQALGEYFAARAAAAESESEAEAFAGVAAYTALSPRDRRDLERMLPALLRGAAVVTRLLHADRRTRPAVRMVPGIVDATARTLTRRAAAGEPIGPVETGHILGAVANRVLAGGPARDAVLRRHARGLAWARRRWYRRHYQYGQGYGTGYAPGYRYAGYPRPGGRYSGGSRTVYRRPVQTRLATGRISRPRVGYVRVVTPVRVPSRGGQPARTVRVVSDVRVPRGAVPAGRPASVGGRRPGR